MFYRDHIYPSISGLGTCTIYIANNKSDLGNIYVVINDPLGPDHLCGDSPTACLNPAHSHTILTNVYISTLTFVT